MTTLDHENLSKHLANRHQAHLVEKVRTTAYLLGITEGKGETPDPALLFVFKAQTRALDDACSMLDACDLSGETQLALAADRLVDEARQAGREYARSMLSLRN